jgi:outer membrane biosynthesis protein TonB
MRRDRYLFLLLVIFLLAGCAKQASPTSKQTGGTTVSVPTATAVKATSTQLPKPTAKATKAAPVPTVAPSPTKRRPTFTPVPSPTPKPTATPQSAVGKKFTLQSPAFSNGDPIPERNAACGGKAANISPTLKWSGAPKGTKSFVLCAMDKVYMVWDKVPEGTSFVHWAVYK